MPAPILVLHDAHASQGRVDASDVLVEAAQIAGALESLGFAPALLPVGLDLAALTQELRALAPYAVFNLVESIEGHGRLVGVVPSLLASLSVPFTGCAATAQVLTSNKLAAKRHLAQAGIATPEPFAADAAGRGRWIVKSVWEHASLGLDDDSVVEGAAAVERTLRARTAEYGGSWFAESYVPGRELNVAVIAAEDGPRVLPIAELKFENFPAHKPQIVGYAAKWHTESFEYRNTVRAFVADATVAARASEIALRCWALFDLDGYARVDMRLAADGRLWVLEVNANPCLSADAGFAAALAEAHIEYATAVGWLVADAVRRSGPASAARERA
jgi:D-alanine-D-alanine ligase